MSRYDSALTTFSPDGNLYQVKYAFEAVQKGKAVVAVRGSDTVVLGVERPVSAKLQNSEMEKKIAQLDRHLIVGYSGLNADARVLVDRTRVECQSYRLTVEDKPSIEYVSRWIAGLQQKYTQRGGVRPFGVSMIVAGFDPEGNPALYKTEPTGNYMAWRACATGHKWEDTSEYLTKHYEPNLDRTAATKLCVESLMEVVEVGRPMEIWVLTKDNPEKPEVLSQDDIDKLRQEVMDQREQERLAREAAAKE